MQLRTNDKSSVLKYVRTRKHFCYKTAQNQTSYKYHILKASENFRSNKLKFQKEEKLLFVSKDFSLSFSCRHFLTLGACGGSGLINQTLGYRKEKLAKILVILQEQWNKLETWGFSNSQLLLLAEHLLSFGAIQEAKNQAKSFLKAK